MKMRISVEQIRELTPEQQEKLREWWKPELYQPMINSHGFEFYLEYLDEGYLKEINSTDRGFCLPLLSIGQLLQLLQDNIKDIRYDPDEENSIQIYKDGVWGRKSHYVSLLNEDICNNLWQAVKEIL